MPEPIFIPKPGQVDYTDIRYAPALDVVVTFNDQILLVKRSADRRLYPGYWATVDGFLDDNKSIEEKALEELEEEIGYKKSDVDRLVRGQPLLREDKSIGKTWLIVPVQAHVRTKKFSLNWEASEARWMNAADAFDLKLLPGTKLVISQFFP
jgi:ADP-ribose pyrophosphatase YjhB (NUDIX family)